MIFWANLIFPVPVGAGAVGSAPFPGKPEQTAPSREGEQVLKSLLATESYLATRSAGLGWK